MPDTTMSKGSHAPLVLHSSEGLGWRGIEAHAYLAPTCAEHWQESAMDGVSLYLLSRGTVHLGDHTTPACPGFYVQQGDMFLDSSPSALYELYWNSLSTEPVHFLKVYLSRALFGRTLTELTDHNLTGRTVMPRAAFQDTLLLQLALTLRRELEQPSSISTLYAETAAQMMIVHLLRYYTQTPLTVRDHAQGLPPRQIRRVTEYVRAHLTQALSLEDLARQTGFSPYHFARLFRQATGESPHQFVVRQRVERARHLLRTTDWPIAHIAVESGFAHQSHLTQAFKRHLGTTPRAFRQTI